MAAAADVGAGAEHLAGAGEHQHPDIVVAGNIVDGSYHLTQHLLGQRIHLVRAVHGEGGYVSLFFQNDVIELHAVLLE